MFGQLYSRNMWYAKGIIGALILCIQNTFAAVKLKNQSIWRVSIKQLSYWTNVYYIVTYFQQIFEFNSIKLQNVVNTKWSKNKPSKRYFYASVQYKTSPNLNAKTSVAIAKTWSNQKLALETSI